MEKLIDIIIPAYKAQAYIDFLMCSLQMQLMYQSLKITIVNDGYGDYSEIIKNYPLLDIQELSYGKNKGCGFARQYGLEHTNCPFVMFCDADDYLYSVESLDILYHHLGNSPEYNVVYSTILCINEGELNDIKPDHFLWLHGVMYRRKFLEDNNISFYPNSAGEDYGFNFQISICSPKNRGIKFESGITYCWTDINKNRINTIDFVLFESKKGLNENLDYVYDWALKKNINIDHYLFKDFCNHYVLYNYYLNTESYSENANKYIEWCKPLFQKYYYKFVNEDIKNIQNQIFKIEKEFYKLVDFYGNQVTWNEFLNLLQS